MPYAIIMLFIVFISKTPVTPLLATIPSLFAKTSLVWPAIVNLVLRKKEKTKNKQRQTKTSFSFF
jgi:hypothetical protein